MLVERDHLPQSEARNLLVLLQRGETPDSIRALIGNGTPYRRCVRLHFDIFVARLPKRGNRLRRRVNGNNISDTLKAEACKLLRAGWSHARILARLPVGPGCVLGLSKRIGASYLKRGRGKRLSPELKAKISEAVKAGQCSAEIERQFQVCWHTVIKFRRAIGDFENRRHRRRLLPQQIEQASRDLGRGEKWSNVAAKLGVSLHTLQKRVSFRKRRELSREQIEQATELLKGGQTWPDVAAAFGVCRSTLQKKVTYRKHARHRERAA